MLRKSRKNRENRKFHMASINTASAHVYRLQTYH